MGLAVLELAAALRDELAGFEPGQLSGADAAVVADALARTEKACAAGRMSAGRRAVEAGVAQSAGFKDGASWMASQSGVTPGQARQELDATRRLDDMPDTKAAFTAGEISPAQMLEIAKAEADTPGVERVLLDVARNGDLGQLRDKARSERQARIPVEELEQRQRERRFFRHWIDEIGMVNFRGALPPGVGVPLVNRIEATVPSVRKRARQTRPEAPPEKFEAYAADALIDVMSESGAKRRGVRSELIVVCSLEALRRGNVDPDEGEVCHIIGGGPITVAQALRFLPDAFLKAVWVEGTDIQKVKHFGRSRPAELETALVLGCGPDFRGRKCADPGCESRVGLQFDHIDPVANCGPTSLENLQALCWRHHQEKTDRDRKAGLLGPHARPSKQQPRAGPFDDP